jgi:predicted DNA-binding protein (UPF0251 family)
MSRPFKCRRVRFLPGVTYFKPAGIPLRMLTENQLTVEEMEAIRLRDLEHLQQVKCATKMNISRPTFQRVLGSARQKVADSLFAGKALRIEGGNYELSTSNMMSGFKGESDITKKIIE